MITMKFRTGLVMVALLAALILPARRAAALDVWAWVGIGIASYAVLVITATTYIYQNPAPLAADEARLPEREDRRDSVHLGSRCGQHDEPGLVIACW